MGSLAAAPGWGLSHLVVVCSLFAGQVNDNFFPGHFPTRPLMPGVLQVEAMAQVGGLVMLTPEVGGSKDNFFFGGVDACRFRKPVLPGDTLVMKVELVKLNKRFGVAKMKAQAFVGDKLACEVRMRRRQGSHRRRTRPLTRLYAPGRADHGAGLRLSGMDVWCEPFQLSGGCHSIAVYPDIAPSLRRVVALRFQRVPCGDGSPWPEVLGNAASTPGSKTQGAPNRLPTALAVPRTPITPTPNTNIAPADARTRPPVVVVDTTVSHRLDTGHASGDTHLWLAQNPGARPQARRLVVLLLGRQDRSESSGQLRKKQAWTAAPCVEPEGPPVEKCRRRTTSRTNFTARCIPQTVQRGAGRCKAPGFCALSSRSWLSTCKRAGRAQAASRKQGCQHHFVSPRRALFFRLPSRRHPRLLMRRVECGSAW